MRGHKILTRFLIALPLLLTPWMSPQTCHALEKATIQLKWLHHFQFAGYYAALEKGFYKDAGLDVTIREGHPDMEVEKEVLSGRADFGVGTSALLLHRAQGEDLVALAQIFQHSPAVFLTSRASGIRSVADMKGRRFMYSNQHGDMLALLQKYAISEKDIIKVPHRGDPNDLLAGKADVMIAYSFNEPFVFEKSGEPYLVFSPMSDGIDFYGDNLFCTRALAESRPHFTQAFRDATLRGWRYAMGHKTEIAELILRKYSREKSKEWLLFEANQLETLIQPTLVEVGYQNPMRWQHIAEVFSSLGMLPRKYDPSAIILRPRQQKYRLLVTSVIACGVVIAILGAVVGLFVRLNRRLRAANAELTCKKSRLRLIFDISMAGILSIDANGRITVANQRMAELFGSPLEEIIGSRYAKLLHPDQRESAEEALRNLMDGRSDRIFSERHYLRSDGSDFWGFLSCRCHRAADGSLISLVGNITDITEQKRAETELKESERRYRTLFNTMHEGFTINEVICDDAAVPVDYRLLQVNPAFERITGIPQNSAVGRCARELFPKMEQSWIDTCGKVALTGEAVELESYIKEDDTYFVSKIYSPEKGRFAVLFADVSVQKRAVRDIQEREAKLRVILESSHAGIITHDADGVITYANRRIADLFGYDASELVGTVFIEHVLPEERGQVRQNIANIFTAELATVAVERRYIKRDGTSFCGYLTASRVVYGDEHPPCMLCVVTDITDLKRAESELSESRRFLADLIEYGSMIIGVKDRDGRYQMVNRKWEDCTGLSREQVLGRTDDEVFPREIGMEFRRVDREVMESGRSIQIEEALEDATGCRFFISSKFPVKGKDERVRGVCVMSTEITERKIAEEERLLLEQQLLHTQKLESLGVLAGGIAHDFNNILLAVLGNANLAVMKLPEDSPAQDNLKRIENAAGQAAELARQMLAYSGKGKFIIENLDLNRLLEEMLHMLEVSITKKASLQLNLARPLEMVEADTAQMRQVIMNMVINAAEAIGDQSGLITITTGCAECDDKYLAGGRFNDKLAPGRYVFLEVADTGCGMSRETVAKIFDPFFTTKFTGRGLGMAAVLGIVRGHKGAITVRSEPGEGSTFRVLVPATGEVVQHVPPVPVQDGWKGSGTVLLVDDEETVRVIGRQMLEELGFSVVTATDGMDALQVFRAQETISFVLLDLTMPRLDGEQCFRELRRLDRDVKVIMSSGYSEHEVTRKFEGKELAGFLQKPYTLDALREAVGKVA